MHNNVIDPEIRARYIAMKGGREFAFDTLDPTRTAHLVIDMQNGLSRTAPSLLCPRP